METPQDSARESLSPVPATPLEYFQSSDALISPIIKSFAFVLIAYAVAELILGGVGLLRVVGTGFTAPVFPRISWAAIWYGAPMLISFGIAVFQLVASLQLFRNPSAGQHRVRLWAWFALGFTVIGMFCNMMFYLAQSFTANQTSIWFQLTAWVLEVGIKDAALPVVSLVLLKRTVR